MKKENLKKIWTAGRIVVGIGLIIFLFWRLDINKVLANIRDLDTRYLFFALIPYFLFVVVSAWRWQVLLDYKKFSIPFGRTIIIYFIGLFFTNFLPTTVGGDVMRVVYSMENRKADSIATVLADRILGFVGLFIFALIAVLYLLIYQQQREFLPFMIVGLVVLVLITYILFSERAYSFVSPIVRKIRLFKLGDRLSRLHETATDFGGAWGAIALCVLLSIAIQALLATVPFLVLRGMGYHAVGIVPFFIYVPIINIVTMIPVSLNGIGIRENSFVLLFSRVGLSGETSASVAVIWFLITFICSIIGGVLFIFYRRK